MRHRRIRFGTSVVAAVLVPLLGLSACGSDDKDDDSNESSQTTDEGATDETSDTAEAETDEEPDAEATESEDSTDDTDTSTTGSNPSWALPVTTPGDLLTKGDVGDVTVEIYQVGNAKATDDGMFVDPDTNKPILQKGDKLVFVNYVITNNGDPIDLGSSRVSIDARYDDWKWMQGMSGDSDSDLYEAQGVNEDKLAEDGFNEKGIYTLGSGESYSYGDNFPYQKNSPITFDVTITPVDAEGELIHDKRMETEIKTTIK